MEDIVSDYLWFEYEGKIISDTWNKYIRCKGDFITQKFLVDKIFREKDLKMFYQLGHSVGNISPLFKEIWADNYMLLEKYKDIYEDSKDTFIDILLLEYHIWMFKQNLKEYKNFLDKLKIV